MKNTLTLHGTIVDVYGVGVLLTGKSGAGKSECALELIERGHRLVADDMVYIELKGKEILLGRSADELIKHYIEIRGLGIINVKDIFGVGAVRNQKRIGMVVCLEKWDSNQEYERLGLEEKTYTILDVKLPYLIIPVRPGRNIATLIEVAALTQRAKRMGLHPAKQLDEKLLAKMNKEKGLDEVF
ncbi:MAG: HPr(Ser) kinase/phosphatase [Candidatus Omnitrophica bacterium]|nr:HPr(Ser) kinase/phosphatase [Candidatus Omnitrophota bacterium]